MQTQSVFDREGEVFRISNLGDDVVNEYRITRVGLEFRIREPGATDWHVVSKADMEMHVALETPVAKWMERRTSELLR
jgi:hypothetical protein